MRFKLSIFLLCLTAPALVFAQSEKLDDRQFAEQVVQTKRVDRVREDQDVVAPHWPKQQGCSDGDAGGQ